jgi:hypothetical protein
MIFYQQEQASIILKDFYKDRGWNNDPRAENMFEK